MHTYPRATQPIDYAIRRHRLTAEELEANRDKTKPEDYKATRVSRPIDYRAGRISGPIDYTAGRVKGLGRA